MWQVAEIPNYRGLPVDAYHTGIKIRLDEALSVEMASGKAGVSH